MCVCVCVCSVPRPYPNARKVTLEECQFSMVDLCVLHVCVFQAVPGIYIGQMPGKYTHTYIGVRVKGRKSGQAVELCPISVQ